MVTAGVSHLSAGGERTFATDNLSHLSLGKPRTNATNRQNRPNLSQVSYAGTGFSENKGISPLFLFLSLRAYDTCDRFSRMSA